MTPTGQELLSSTADAFQALPGGAHLIAAGGLVAGLVLWAMGRAVLRPIFAIFGSLAGAWMGFFLLPTLLPPEVHGIPSHDAGMIGGGLAGLAAGVMLFRFAVATITGGSLGIAGILAAAAYLHVAQPPTDPSRLTVGESARAVLVEHVKPSVSASLAKDPAYTHAERLALIDQAQAALGGGDQTAGGPAGIRAFLASGAQSLASLWEGLGIEQRLLITAAGFGAGGAGFMLGLLTPRRSSAVMTALFGAAVWLPSAVWLARAAGASPEFLDRSPAWWLTAWGVAALMGMAIQWRGASPRKAPAPAPQPAAQ